MTAATAAGSYPLTYDVEYPAELSRWLIFVKWLLGIPHFIIVYLLQIGLNIVTLIAWFAILFTKTYPRELFNFATGVYRWQANVSAYSGLLRDEYPPFSWDPGEYAVTFDIEYPGELSRWLIFVKWLLAIPHLIVLVLLAIGAAVVYIVAFFAILFTKKFPKSLFQYIVGFQRYTLRVTAYIGLLTDQYPPFSLQP